MQNKRNKKELTRLILAALILGSGSLYGNMAEAKNAEVTADGQRVDVSDGTDNTTKFLEITSAGTGDTLRFNYNSTYYKDYYLTGGYTTITPLSGGLYVYHNAGTVKFVWGEYSGGSEDVNGNHVFISGGKLDASGGIVGGGYSSSGAVSGNYITISSGQGIINVYGGRSESGNVTNNHIILEGTDSAPVVIDAAVFAGASGISNDVSGNSVTLKGKATVGTYIYGGLGNTPIKTGAAGDNILYFAAGANGNTVGHDVYGFRQYVVNSDFTFKKDGIVLSANKIGNYGSDTSDLILDIHGATTLLGDTDVSHYGTMTLLSSTQSSLGGFKLNYNGSTPAVFTTQKVNETNITSDTGGTTVSLDGKRTHTMNNTGTAITYDIANNISKVTFGDVTWGTTPRTLTLNQYIFGSGTTIDKTNLEFTNPEAVSGSMTLLANATGITGDNIAHSQNYTKTANGTSLGMTLAGNITRGSNAIGYTATGNTVNSIDLSGWTGSTYAMGTGWTSGLTTDSITAEGFTLPDENTDIFTTNIAGFFNDTYITGSQKYSGGTELVDDTAKGVTLTGYKGGGVKATDSGKKLSYFKEMMDTQSITLGQMTWGQGRTAASGYNFANIGNGEIDATGLTFTNPAAATGSMDLLSGATDLQAGLTIVNPNHSQNFTGSAAANGATFDGTITGTVATAAKKITYTVGTKNITGIDLAGWNGTSTALGDWTAATSGVAVKAEGFTAPTLTAGTSTNIFTTSGTGFFSDTNITGAQKYGASTTPSSDTDKGVTFTGSQQKGVKASANGQNLVYAVGDMTVSDITLGNMEVGTPRTATGNYTFYDTTTIDATNLKFDNPADVADATDSTLVTGATGITSSNTVTEPSHSQAITNAAIGTGGIKVSGTLNGTVSAVAGGVNYTVNNKTISSMDLSGWDTTTENTTLPDAKWTGSNVTVNANSFAAAAPTENKTIFTTTTENFFGDVTGDLAYKSGAAFSGDEGNGVTLSGTKSGGVKKSDDGSDLEFIAEARTVNNIALGNMTWNSGRAMPATGYTFSVADNGVDATNLKFSFTGTEANTLAAGANMSLLTNATGLTAGLTVKGSPVSQSISYGIDNVATLNGTLTGNVSTLSGTVQYTVADKTLSAVDISGWNGTATGTVDNSWSKAASGIAVTGSGFTAPTTVGNHDILTATPTGYFTGAQIADSIAYKTGSTFSETASNITLSGTQDRGVKASTDGTALQYSIGNANINNIKIGNVTYTQGGPLIDKSAALYDYSQLNSNGLDISGFGLTMTDDQKKSAKATDSMTLVKANGTLDNIDAKETGKSTYTYNATSGLAVKGAVTGEVAAANHNVVYTVTGNNATTLTFGTVGWNSTYARTDSEIAYTGALVNADNITFTGVDSLNEGQSMVLVSNYGGEVNKIRSGIFTLNGQTGKGYAYYDNGSLYYKITRAAGTEVPTANAIGITETVDNNPGHQGDVIGGQAKGDGESTNNEVDVKDSEIKKKDDGTGGDVKGGTSEDGPSQENKADVKDSKVEGDVIGGESDSGPSRRNQAIVRGSTIGGDVSGGDTNGGGDTEENKTEVKDSTVGGDVNGGHSGGNGNSNKNDVDVDHTTVDGDVNGGNSDGDGNADGNNTDVKNGSKVGGDVNGGHSGGNGHTNGNNANVDGSTVDGDVNGGKSDGNGDANENKTDVKNGSKVGGSVTGGQSNGGNTNKNETTVSGGSTVTKDVIGGKTNGDGTSNENKTNVDGSNVGGSVIGGQSQNGDADKNETNVTGGSTVGGDVIGGKTTGTGNANENKTNVDGSNVSGNVTGGQSQNGDASENKTDVKNGSTVGGNVTGGQSNGGNTNKNETTVSGGSTVNGDVTGGKTSGTGTSSENKTNVDGSNVGGNVIGGQSENGDANKNETNVTGGSTVTKDVIGGKTTGTGNANENKTNVDGSNVSGNVIGGYSQSGNASANETSVSGGSVGGSVYGGQSNGNGNANTNKVNLAGGVNVNGNVYGGYSATGDASGNGIDIGTGKVNGDIYGGFSGGSGSTINNTITLHGGADVSNSNIIGGNNGTAGNTLNIGNSNEPWTGGSQSVKNISGFETLNYTNFAWNSSTPALTISDGTSSDLSGTTIAAKQVAFTGIKTLNAGATMTLLDQSRVAADKRATNVNAGSEFTVGTATEGTGKLVLDADGNVIYQVESAGASRQTHNTVMAAEAAAVALNAGNDFILSAREGLARKENIGKDGVAVFAKIGGGAMRQETGSHVNVNMWNGIVALGRKNVQKESTTEYGVFIEHGWGNFSTHSDNAHRGDGSVDYTGGGLLGKWMKADGLYVEGSLRIGSMHEKANNLLRDTVRGYGYDERTTYKGFHLGVGKEFAVNDGNTVEVYGKYFYNRKDGMNFNAGLDEYNLDAVTSQILRVGARYTMKRERWNYYGDLSYEHELDGQAKGRANGMAIRGADTSGGSVRLELGAKLLANEKSPWTLDLNLTGYAGKKQGLQGGVSVKFMF